MRSLSAEALLLDVINLQEKDRIVSFLTAEHGKKRGAAPGARTKYSRFAGQLQPLAKVAVTWFEKDGRDLVRISDVELVRPAAALQTELEGILLGAYMAELIGEFAMEDEESTRSYRLLDTTIEAMLAGCDQNLAARYLEVWVLRLGGIFPVPWECPFCGRPIAERAILIASEAAMVCSECGAGHRRIKVGPEELDFLRRSASENLGKMSERPPSRDSLGRIEGLCAHIRRQFLQAELRSYRVMKETLGSLV